MDRLRNDLLPVCGTTKAQITLDRLISADRRSGAMPDFLNKFGDSCARVIVLSYDPVSDQGAPFVQCETVLSELALRQAHMADLSQSVFLVDAGLGIRAGDIAAYAPDLVHPSPRVAARVGRLIASAIRRNDG